jgi:glycosyltransferase involved in cell wall biosynthesis
MIDFKLSIIVPVYSETVSVMETLERLFKNDRGYIEEIILIISPKSSQACLDICRQAALDFKQVRFIIQGHNPGVGWAIRERFEAAQGTHCVIMAADLETQPETVDRMFSTLKETGCDVVSASRWQKGGGFEGYGCFRMYINYLFQRLLMFLFKTPISDLTLAFKLYRRDLLKNMRLDSTGSELPLEIILKIIKLGARIEEVPTTWIKRAEGQSKNKSVIITLSKCFWTAFKVHPVPMSTWHND